MLRRRVIVNADDFGASPSINAAVAEAYDSGILTSASLMVTGGAVDEAVELARVRPGLGVGWHVTLVQGTSASGRGTVPRLTDASGEFDSNPVRAGLRYFFNRGLRAELTTELDKQFALFRGTGLPLDHVNGHLNLHLHPTILSLLIENSGAWGIRALRITKDPFWLNARLARGRWIYRSSQALIFHILAAAGRVKAREAGIAYAPHVFGLLQNGLVGTAYLRRLLPRLPLGVSEIYSHPSTVDSPLELEALLDPEARRLMESLGIERVRYQDLASKQMSWQS